MVRADEWRRLVASIIEAYPCALAATLPHVLTLDSALSALASMHRFHELYSLLERKASSSHAEHRKQSLHLSEKLIWVHNVVRLHASLQATKLSTGEITRSFDLEDGLRQHAAAAWICTNVVLPRGRG